MRWSMRVAALTVCSSAVLAAQQPGADGWTPVLQIRAVSSTPQGSRVGVAGEWRIVKDGEPLDLTFVAGPTLCRMGVGSSRFAPPEASTSTFRRLDGRESSASTTQTLSLRDGDEVTLDAVSEPVDGTCNVHTVTFNARLAMLPSTPALAQTAYAADLWLIHDGPFSAQMRDHLVINVDGLSGVPFRFQPLMFSLPQVDPRQGTIRASISLSGSIRGRTRADGLVDVDLETNRLVYGIISPESIPPLTSTIRKTLTLKPGETTAIEFPPPSSGVSTVPLDQASGNADVRVGAAQTAPVDPRNAVQVVHGRLVLDTPRFFKGHKTQLLIRLKPLP
jgi:hypothetical protein